MSRPPRHNAVNSDLFCSIHPTPRAFNRYIGRCGIEQCQLHYSCNPSKIPCKPSASLGGLAFVPRQRSRTRLGSECLQICRGEAIDCTVTAASDGEDDNINIRSPQQCSARDRLCAGFTCRRSRAMALGSQSSFDVSVTQQGARFGWLQTYRPHLYISPAPQTSTPYRVQKLHVQLRQPPS